MSEPAQEGHSSVATAGTLLREARQARGVHLMALSASLKVAPGRLEAMEADRWHELPDAAYARALAHTVSRALGIDPQPVLRGLPAASRPRLESLDEGLDQPFRERATGSAPSVRRHRWSVVSLGLALALVVWWFLDHRAEPAPQGIPTGSGGVAPPPSPALAASALSDAPVPLSPSAAATTAATATPTATPAVTAAATVPAAAPSSASAAAPVLLISAQKSSWIELRDAQGQVALQRLLAAGEGIELRAPSPGTLTVGNAAGTLVMLGGRPIDLAAVSRENVARIELR